jgi:hypothetical protein
MSMLGLWNPDKELDMVDRPDMFGLGAEHAWVRSLKPG